MAAFCCLLPGYLSGGLLIFGAVLFQVQARLEEATCSAARGTYAEYCRRVGRFLPFSAVGDFAGPRRTRMNAPMNVTQTDVLVVGGGVAGATTARLLAEAGHRVIVLDRARFPRDKPCGEGVMPTGVRLLARLGVLEKIPSDISTSSGASASSSAVQQASRASSLMWAMGSAPAWA